MESRVLGDRYELRRPIGSGGMARVYLAVDRLLGREVAVKVLHHEAAADPEFVERFRREARAAAMLNHPNIVAIYDWGAVDDTYYMVMEYVPGPNLKEVLREHGPLPEIQALDIAAQTAAALQAAHEHQIIHRDVKPHNILIDPNGRVKVTDFGIARAQGLSQLTRTNIVSGTAHYLSPEQAQRRQVDGRSDVYSLGVVLFEMLAGREPFQGDSLVEVALQHVHAPPPPLSELRPDLSPLTERALARALAKDPGQRYQSAREMQDALNTVRTRLLNAPIKEVEETAPARIVEANLPDPATPFERTEVAPTAPAARRVATPAAPHPVNRWLLAVPLALLILVLAGLTAVARPAFLFGTTHRAAAGHPAQHHVAGVSRPSPTPTPTHAPRRTTMPVRAAPPVAPTPTPTPPPQPTAAPTSTTASSPPTAVVASSQGGGDPRQAVLSFYSLVNSGQYGQAAQLWTSGMQGRCSPSECINHRFSGSQINVESATVVSRGNGHASVAVTLQEVTGGGSTRTWYGTWDLIKSNGQWLLDSSVFQQG